MISNSKDKSTREALNEIDRLLAEKPLKLAFETFDKKDKNLIVYHNCQSLVAHFDDINCDKWYSNADIMIFSETNTKRSDNFHFSGYSLFYRTDGSERLTARGMVFYKKNDIYVEVLLSSQSKSIEDHCDFTLFKIGVTFVISGYRSPNCIVSVAIDQLENLLTYVSVGSKIIFLGDMNEGGKSFVSKILMKYDCVSAIPDNIVTTDYNTAIDIIFTNDQTATVGTYESYFSYHKPIFIYTNLIQNESKKSNVDQVLPPLPSANNPLPKKANIAHKKVPKFNNAKENSKPSSKLLEQEGIRILDRILDYDDEILEEKMCIEKVLKLLTDNTTLTCFEQHLMNDDIIKIRGEEYMTDLHFTLNSNYCSVDVKGDGACFYRSISYSIFRTEDYHPWIRLMTVKSMIKHQGYFNKLTNEIFKDDTFYELIIRTASLETYADNMSIYALCLGISRNILINVTNTMVLKNNKIRQNEISAFSVSNTTCMNPIMLRNSGQHYKTILLQSRKKPLSFQMMKCCMINVQDIPKILQNNDSTFSTDKHKLSQNLFKINDHQEMVIKSIENIPPTGEIISKFGLRITKDHIISLYPGVWLNSDIINFYLKLIMHRCNESSSLPSIYCFETYFLNILSRSFERAETWVKKNP